MSRWVNTLASALPAWSRTRVAAAVVVGTMVAVGLMGTQGEGLVGVGELGLGEYWGGGVSSGQDGPIVPGFWKPRPNERKLSRFRANDEVVSIIVTVFDQEENIGNVIQAILSTTVGPYELIVIMDGCSDSSELIIDSKIQKHRAAHVDFPGRGLIKYSKAVNGKSKYETLCNNMGLRAGVGRNLIIVQDDMKMAEFGWDRIMLRPMLLNHDILALSARCAHNDYSDPTGRAFYWNELVGEGGDHNFWINYVPVKIEIRDICNRGPFIVSAEKAEGMGFLNETFAPFELDDHEICLRGKKLHDYKCGWYPVSVRSESVWSHRRNGKPKDPALAGAEGKNIQLLLQGNAEYLRTPAPHATPSRAVEEWGFEDVPRTIFTVMEPSESHLIETLHESILLHEPRSRFIIYLLTGHPLPTRMSSWSRAIIRYIDIDDSRHFPLSPEGRRASHRIAALEMTVKEFGGLVMWMDPGVRVKSIDLGWLVWREVGNDGVWVRGVAGDGVVGNSTLSATREYLDAGRVLFSPQIDSKIFGFNTQTADVMELVVRPLIACGLNPHCMSPPNPDEKLHMYDASVLGILVAKNGYPVDRRNLGVVLGLP